MGESGYAISSWSASAGYSASMLTEGARVDSSPTHQLLAPWVSISADIQHYLIMIQWITLQDHGSGPFYSATQLIYKTWSADFVGDCYPSDCWATTTKKSKSPAWMNLFTFTWFKQYLLDIYIYLIYHVHPGMLTVYEKRAKKHVVHGWHHLCVIQMFWQAEQKSHASHSL